MFLTTVREATAKEHNARAVELRHKGDDARALIELGEALRLDTRHAPAYLNRGAIRFARREFIAAVDDFTRALAIDPELVAAYHNRGAARLALRDYNGAFADFDAEVLLAPNVSRGYLCRAHARYHLRDPQAEDDYRQAFRLDPAYSARRVIQLLIQSIRPTADAALVDCDAHLRQNPRDFHSLARRGLIRLLHGQHQQAMPDFECYRRLNPHGAFKLDLMIREVERIRRHS